MNKSLVVSSILAVLLIVYFAQDADEPARQVDSSSQSPSASAPGEESVETATTPAEENAETARKEAEASVELQAHEKKAVKLRQELEALIQEYDQIRSDPDRRRELKEKIDMKMAEYNAELLPVAVNSMQK